MKKLLVLNENDFCRAKKIWIKKNINKVNNLSDSGFIRDLIKSYLGEKKYESINLSAMSRKKILDECKSRTFKK